MGAHKSALLFFVLVNGGRKGKTGGCCKGCRRKRRWTGVKLTWYNYDWKYWHYVLIHAIWCCSVGIQLPVYDTFKAIEMRDPTQRKSGFTGQVDYASLYRYKWTIPRVRLYGMKVMMALFCHSFPPWDGSLRKLLIILDFTRSVVSV